MLKNDVRLRKPPGKFKGVEMCRLRDVEDVRWHVLLMLDFSEVGVYELTLCSCCHVDQSLDALWKPFAGWLSGPGDVNDRPRHVPITALPCASCQ